MSSERKTELFKLSSVILAIGVLLIGIAAIGFYLELKKSMERGGGVQEPLWARCVEDAIIITAREDLKDVVVSARGEELCRFDSIGKGSEEVCYINTSILNETRVFVVRAGDLKKAVVCYQPVKPVPLGTSVPVGGD
ncbi:hypothetical protein GAH_00725 [Geoglobus ahangari]|uniref:Uncharacterized protein n=1 Tax=Geoglobus ahangari TaxID=113653 RepID=A0A0F7IFM1_9EURY|nr:hypothetical protein [Geoglobus ahangari]AKG91940.1 hypothetical protein GAH_00725 [Geoglobus ahangari]